MENIQNLITNIYSKNLVEAKTLFESILHEKCSLTLENVKKEIAKTFLGGDVKEDVEQLDELSKNTLTNYIDKADRSISHLAKNGYNKNSTKIHKRINGIGTAELKLTKTGDPHYAEGKMAYINGTPKKDNPHPRGTYEHGEWARGHDDGKYY